MEQPVSDEKVTGPAEETAIESVCSPKSELQKGGKDSVVDNDSAVDNDSSTLKQEIENGHSEMAVDNNTEMKDENSSDQDSSDNDVTCQDDKIVKENDLEVKSIVKDEAVPTNVLSEEEVPPSNHADFAVIHSFLTMFGIELDLPVVSLIDLDFVFSPKYKLSIDKGIFSLYYYYDIHKNA